MLCNINHMKKSLKLANNHAKCLDMYILFRCKGGWNWSFIKISIYKFHRAPCEQQTSVFHVWAIKYNPATNCHQWFQALILATLCFKKGTTNVGVEPRNGNWAWTQFNVPNWLKAYRWGPTSRIYHQHQRWRDWPLARCGPWVGLPQISRYLENLNLMWKLSHHKD